jgi:hypothetical protein
MYSPISFLLKCIRFGVPLAWNAFGWFRILVPIVIGAVLFCWRASVNQDLKDSLSALTWIIPLSVLLAVALVAIFCAPYYLWKQVCDERDNLDQKLVTLSTPRLEAECSPDIDGCRKENLHGAGFNQAFRVAVRATGIAPVTGCKGQLREIKGPSTIWSSDTAILAFAPGENEDSRHRTIAHDETVYLDVFFLEYDSNWSFIRSVPATKDGRWNFKPRWQEIFAAYGEYTFKIEILAPPTPTLKLNLRFTWTGDKTSRMDLIR